jgi:prevent-host-death family protein
MRTVTSVDAQNHFGELLDNAQREPITITRRGRPVAYIVSSEAYRTLAGRVSESPQAVGYLNEIASFRGSGMKGATDALLADRVADRLREA